MVLRPGTNYVRVVEGQGDWVEVVRAVAELLEGEASRYQKNVGTVVAKRTQSVPEKFVPVGVC